MNHPVRCCNFRLKKHLLSFSCWHIWLYWCHHNGHLARITDNSPALCLGFKEKWYVTFQSLWSTKNMSTLNMKFCHLENFFISSKQDSWSKISEHLLYDERKSVDYVEDISCQQMIFEGQVYILVYLVKFRG